MSEIDWDISDKIVTNPFISCDSSYYEKEEMKTVTGFSFAIKYGKIPLFIKYINDSRSEIEMTADNSKRYVGRPYGIQFRPDGQVRVCVNADEKYYKGKEI
jgi:hypothetical protein